MRLAICRRGASRRRDELEVGGVLDDSRTHKSGARVRANAVAMLYFAFLAMCCIDVQ